MEDRCRVLSLDLATRMGFSYETPEGYVAKVISFARKPPTKTRPPEFPGQPFLSFSKWLNGMLKTGAFQSLVFEDTGSNFPNLNAAASFFGFRGQLLMQAARYQKPVYRYSPATLKKWATGYGRASKEDMLEVSRKHLPEVTDDNAVDAFLMLRMHQEHMSSDTHRKYLVK